METYHLIDVSYFVALSCRHLFDRSREGPYMIRLARYFRLLSTVKQASTFTMIPHGFSIMSHIGMILLQHKAGTHRYTLFHQDPRIA
ncbi:hypothetical protein V6Z12_D02G091700 [Gossypium hirsutum]